MSFIRTNKKTKRLGDFQTRAPKKDDFTEYVYEFGDGSKFVIVRSELSPEVDELMYEELKKECNNNRTQIEEHRAYSKDPEKNDVLLNMQPDNFDMEEAVSKKVGIEKAIKSLRPEQQELFYKKYIQGKTNTEIAREEGVSEGKIREELIKIKKQFEKFLK